MNSTSSETSLGRDLANALRYYLTGRRGLIVAGVAILGLGATFGSSSTIVAAALPLLIALAPCLIMCGLGFCFMKACNKGSSTNQAASPGETAHSPEATPTAVPVAAATATPNLQADGSASVTSISDRRASEAASCCETTEPAAESRRA